MSADAAEPRVPPVSSADAGEHERDWTYARAYAALRELPLVYPPPVRRAARGTAAGSLDRLAAVAADALPWLPAELPANRWLTLRTAWLRALAGSDRARFERALRGAAAATVDDCRDRAVIDAQGDLTAPFHTQVMALVLQVTPADAATLLATSFETIGTDGPRTEPERAMRLLKLKELVSERAQERPGPVAAFRAAARPYHVSFDDAVTMAVQTIVGSTTVRPVGAAALGLIMGHADARVQGARSPLHARPLVQEALRLLPPAPPTPRASGGQDLVGSVGTDGRTIVDLTAANRDPAVFAHPDTFVPGRRTPHLTFGTGVYRCPGAGLVTLELSHLVHAVCARLPNARPHPDDPAPRFDRGQMIPEVVRLVNPA